MKIRTPGFAVSVAIILLSASSALAAPVTPTYDTFGDLSGATFGGSGIPTDPTAITSFTGIRGDTVTFGLSATQRFANPALGNDGAGTYFATPGLNNGTPGDMTGLLGATWNFSYFLSVTDNGGDSTLADYGIKLLYDFDSGAGTDDTLLGVIDFSALFTAFAFDPVLLQDSQNLAFGFLGISTAWITPPAFSPFDPLAGGEYSFSLRSSSYSAEASINVVIPRAVPEPAAAILLLTGLGMLALFQRRFRIKGVTH